MSIKRYITAPLVGYVVLGGAIGYAINAERLHSDAADRARAVETQRLLLDGCLRDNILREGISQVLIASDKRETGSSGSTPGDATRSDTFVREQLPKFVQINCPSAIKTR